MKWALVAVLALALGGGGFWFYAKTDLESRYRETLVTIAEIGVERDGNLPSDDRVRERVEAAAQKHGLVASGELDVSRSEGIAPMAKGLERMMNPTGALPVYGSTIVVRGRLSGKLGLFKLNKPFEQKIVIRGNLTPHVGGGARGKIGVPGELPTSGDHLRRFDEPSTKRGE